MTSTEAVFHGQRDRSYGQLRIHCESAASLRIKRAWDVSSCEIIDQRSKERLKTDRMTNYRKIVNSHGGYFPHSPLIRIYSSKADPDLKLKTSSTMLRTELSNDKNLTHNLSV